MVAATVVNAIMLSLIFITTMMTRTRALNITGAIQVSGGFRCTNLVILRCCMK